MERPLLTMIFNIVSRYPDATAEELANTDNVCIICREEMLAPTTKKLPCNHIFHKICLRSWFQRQQTCPTCRLDVLRAPVQGGLQRPRGQQQPQQQQQQQQQQQPAQPAAPAPQIPPFPGFDPNFFAQLVAAANARATVPPNIPTAAQVQSGAQGSTRSEPMTTPPIPPPFMIPPFFPPPPFLNLPPPPMPPPNFTGLTDSELRAMEGQERTNVEARIKVLRNIQVLLDAAVMEMNQYTAVVSRLNTIAPHTAPANGVPPGATTSPTTGEPSTSSSAESSIAASGGEPSAETLANVGETGARPKTSTAAAAAVVKEEEELIRAMDRDDKGLSSDDVIGEEQIEIRRRRLEKFEKKEAPEEEEEEARE